MSQKYPFEYKEEVTKEQPIYLFTLKHGGVRRTHRIEVSFSNLRSEENNIPHYIMSNYVRDIIEAFLIINLIVGRLF